MAAPPITPDRRAPAGRSPEDGSARQEIRSGGVRPSPGTERAPAEDWVVALAAHTRFDGLLAFSGRAQIDGELAGNVVGRGALRVGVGARIDGTVEADEVVVLGQLRGDVIARARIELGATARVTGSLQAPAVSLLEGALLEGRCEMPPPPDPANPE